jgi:hypothetical protein
LKDEIRMLRESLGAEGGVAAADADITGMNTTTHDNY